MINTNLVIARKLELTSIKKDQRYVGQVKIELDWLYDWIPALTIFVEHLCRKYNNKKITKNIKVKQDINPE